MSRPKVTILKALEKAVPPGSSVLVAVSGGLDSVSLLHACVETQSRLNLTVEVAHVDHGLRKESSRDAKFVAELCRKYGLPFHVRTAASGPGKENVEDWGRKLRYSFFTEIVGNRKLDYVLTAHTANDVAETFLMRLLSNKELNSILPSDEKRSVIRPLLPVSRKEIEDYARRHKLEHVEDATNRDTGFLRNRVRHTLIPLLEEKFDKRIVEVLSLRAEAVAADNFTLYSLCDASEARLSELKFGSKEWLRLVRKEIGDLPQGARWRFAERLTKSALGFNLGREHSEKLVLFLMGEAVGIELPGGLELRAKGGGIVFRTPEKVLKQPDAKSPRRKANQITNQTTETQRHRRRIS